MYGSAQRSEIMICTMCRASYRDPRLTTCPRDGAPLTVWAEDPMIGQVLGDRYQIVEPIGQGGMGSVYLAERLDDELEVAVKIVRSEHLRNATVHERFLREVKHTTAIDSPHVVKIIDHGMSQDGRAYMVMEYLEGESLTERLRRPPALSAYEALHVARDVGRALAAAHEASVIHRDLKPDNIFLCADGRVKVLDFGIAKAYERPDRKHNVSEPSLTEAHRVVGTPVYMAPEVITKTGLYPSSDLYALGVILYEMLIGEPPFFEKDAIGTMYRHLHEQPKRVREVDERLKIPGALETLIRDLLTKKPKERPSDANAIVARIDAIRRIVRENEHREIDEETGDLTKVWSPKERDSTMPDVPDSQPRRRRRRRGRNWGMLVLAAIAALAIGFAVTAAVIYFVKKRGNDTVQLPGG